MRACFLGQNVCALGYGVATLQTPPMPDEDPAKPKGTPDKPGRARQDQPGAMPAPFPVEKPYICNN